MANSDRDEPSYIGGFRLYDNRAACEIKKAYEAREQLMRALLEDIRTLRPITYEEYFYLGQTNQRRPASGAATNIGATKARCDHGPD